MRCCAWMALTLLLVAGCGPAPVAYVPYSHGTKGAPPPPPPLASTPSPASAAKPGPSPDEQARKAFFEGRAALEAGKAVIASEKLAEIERIFGVQPRRVMPLYARALFDARRHVRAAEVVDAYFAMEPDRNLAEFAEIDRIKREVGALAAKERAELAAIARLDEAGLRTYLNEADHASHRLTTQRHLGREAVSALVVRDCDLWIEWTTEPKSFPTVARVPLDDVRDIDGSRIGPVVLERYPPPTSPPPAPRSENPGSKPGHLWSKGHYEWRGGRYRWSRGEWLAPKPSLVLLDPVWYQPRDDSPMWEFRAAEFKSPRNLRTSPPPPNKAEASQPDGHHRWWIPGYWKPDPANDHGYVWVAGRYLGFKTVPGRMQRRGHYYDYFREDLPKADGPRTFTSCAAKRYQQLTLWDDSCRGSSNYVGTFQNGRLRQLQLHLGGERPAAIQLALSRLRNLCHRR